MNHTQEMQTSNLASDTESKGFRWTTAALWIGILALVILVAYVLYMVAFPSNSTAIGAEKVSFSSNPELMAAQRYAQASSKRAANLDSSANPELRAAQRFAIGRAAAEDTNTLYTNPELKAVQTGSLIPAKTDGDDFLAINPEIKSHLRFLEE
jgi:hypothetical protein